MNDKMYPLPFKNKLLPWLIAAALAPACAQAQERESLEQLRQTTINLIDALVEQGVLTRAKADALIAQAKEKAAAAVAAAPASEPSKVQRVPYVPQVVRDQIRAEVKEEVLAHARSERWGVPDATPAWLDRITISGDIRVRHQSEWYGNDNLTATGYRDAAFNNAVTRAADFTEENTGNLLATGNASQDRSRLRLRARLGVTAKVTDMVSAGVRLATGSATDRVSTNQTLGSAFNKYTILLDQAWVQVDPMAWLSIKGGRMPNPWFSTDLVWDEDLNFDGLAATAKWLNVVDGVTPYATLGAFPLREDSPPSRAGRWLYGAQAGVEWLADSRTRVKFGVALYDYKNIEGRTDADYTLSGGPGPTYGQYAYPKGWRQKGNTLFGTNLFTLEHPTTPNDYLWGLASKFRPLAVTAAAELAYFNPFALMLSGEYVVNTGYDEKDMLRRLGYEELTTIRGRKTAYQLRAAFGQPQVKDAGDWQASLTYKWLGSDSVLDAFTDSDFGLGGTNMQGIVLGFTYGVDRNATLGLRYLSAKSIDSMTGVPGATDKFSVDTLQVDFNVRF